jgi:hypothetical protein
MCSVLVIAYSLNQFIMMAQFGSTNFNMNEFKNYFQATDVISGAMNKADPSIGFNIAFGIWSYGDKIDFDTVFSFELE